MNSLTQLQTVVANSADTVRDDLFAVLMSYISLSFYILIFIPAINALKPRSMNDYLGFVLPGLVVIAFISGVSQQALHIWAATSQKIMPYWLSLPCSRKFFLLMFSFQACLHGLVYSVPLLFLHLVLSGPSVGVLSNIIGWAVLVCLSSVLLFLVNFCLVLAMARTPYFTLIFQTSQPILVRVAPVFYPLTFLPLIALPFAVINPVTWVVMAMRDPRVIITVIGVLTVFVVFLLAVTDKYWKRKVDGGALL